MTEKRFYLGNGKLFTICDGSKGGSDGFNGLTRWEVLDLLNEQHEEIQKLKAQLYCTADGVCGICNNEYLVPQGKYYISKCKKGHEECSKRDLDYCDDFELKDGDVE
jgi:hypothetical protein